MRFTTGLLLHEYKNISSDLFIFQLRDCGINGVYNITDSSFRQGNDSFYWLRVRPEKYK